ncbi:AlbA family DNA-binding domain-containing protein [Paenibacillus koleovorans]|uniref:AlbA family DNA-binding domain-containing protein n=1 Tax=Paenibacillus koleovorans TaxID=121608 RepID=UPI000FD707D1|nr:ATP-binding protein [Paenibacillus koleovorans]
MSFLPINLDDLIHTRSIESIRVEYKKTWNPVIMESVIHSICAYANDFFNLNGGYIIIGIEEKEGRPLLPPFGVDDIDLDQFQKDVRGQCNRFIPEYQPLIVPVTYMNKQLMVIYAPAGEARPYQAPVAVRGGEKAYYIRQGSQSVHAQGNYLTQLLQMTERIPFDDRRNYETTVDDLSPTLVRSF